MEYNYLGQTGIKVSRLCFGTLTLGPLQGRLSLGKGAGVLRRAFDLGVNFLDTADLYMTYPYIREALRGDRREVVLASKSYDYTREGMKKSLERALRETGRDYIDIFLLHEQESELTIKGHWEAVEYLLESRDRGTVRAIGISTHSVRGVLAAARVPQFDVIHPLINMAGVGILDGDAADMAAAISEARRAGKGIYGMKALGGGNLRGSVREAFDYIMSLEDLDSVAVGMRTLSEVEYNVRLFEGREIPGALASRVQGQKRRLHVEDWCIGCGRCVERCGAGALSIVSGRALVDSSLCRLCGYCGAACSDMCIKII